MSPPQTNTFVRDPRKSFLEDVVDIRSFIPGLSGMPAGRGCAARLSCLARLSARIRAGDIYKRARAAASRIPNPTPYLMSISFAATGPQSGTFLNPLPQVRHRSEEELEHRKVDAHHESQPRSEQPHPLPQVQHRLERELEQPTVEAYDGSQPKSEQLHVIVQHHFNLDVTYQVSRCGCATHDTHHFGRQSPTDGLPSTT